MKKILNVFIVLVLITGSIHAQKAHDVLEDGLPVEKNDNLFLKSTGDVMKYYLGELPVRPLTLEDSLVFLVKNSSVNVYLKPLNPLNFSYKTENKLIIDPIDEDAANALKSISSIADVVNTSATRPATLTPDCYDSVETMTEKIKSELTKDQKVKITEQFNLLKAMTFADEESTKRILGEVSKEIKTIEAHFVAIDTMIRDLKGITSRFNCTGTPNVSVLITKHVFGQIALEFTRVKDEQYKRLSNLKKAYALIEEEQKKASEDKDGLRWCVFLDEVPAPKGKISVYSVTINKSGYRLSTEEDKEIDKGEIIPDASSVKIKRTIHVRRFQRFVPEVSAGVAYTNLSFPKYGTVTDTATGKLHVAEAGNDVFKRMNITAMLNYNYFIQNSPVHPFVQVGAGVNVDFPTLFLGGGLRFNNNGKGRIAIAGGMASSWIKTLNDLKIGDEVSGTTDIEKDITYEFATPQFYLGIQYNF